MTSDILLNAIGEIDDDLILSAGARLGRGLSQTARENIETIPTKPRRSSRKLFIGIAAAIMLILAFFITGMAVHEEFREAVYAFFNIATSETVPEYKPDTNDDNGDDGDNDDGGDGPGGVYAETEIGGLVNAKYVWLSGFAVGKNGIFHCSRIGDSNRNLRFVLYAEENGELIPIETTAVNMEHIWNGREYHIEFEWGAYGDAMSVAYVSDSGDEGWGFSYIQGNPDAMLITFDHALPGGEDYPIWSKYPMLFDLKNETVIDLLEGCGVENLPDITNVAFSDDFTKALFAQSDGSLYYCDITAKALYSVSELSGERADACVLTDGALSCWALGGDGNYNAWNISLDTFQRTETFSGIPRYDVATGAGVVFISGFDIMHHDGYMYGGCGFALEVSEDRSVYVIDISTGEKTIVENLAWNETPVGGYIDLVDNPAGTRLLIAERISGSLGYDRIGVIDSVSQSYIRFSREDFSINEVTAYWFDSDRIVVSTAYDADGRSEAYVYSFKDN